MDRDVILLLQLFGTALLAIGLMSLLRSRRRTATRQAAVAQLLDAADTLEARLRTARTELSGSRGEVDPTHEAMREMLRQRLWLQQHGAAASLDQLHAVRRAIQQAGQRIEDHLSRVDAART